MGKALLIIALGFSTLFGTITLNLSRHSLESVENFSSHYNNAIVRNCATSGIYMALSKLYQNNAWRAGLSKTLPVGSFNVVVQDYNVDPTLSTMELKMIATSSYQDANKTIEVLLGLPPDLADLAVFVTDTIINVTVLDELGNPDPSLAIQNAPSMLPFDKNGLVSLAVSQGHVKNGDFSCTNNYPSNSFYYNVATAVPNVTHVKGNFTIGGGIDGYGIFVVEGNAVLDGSARLNGVLYLPNPGSIVIHGGGNPNESSITGGVFANGYLSGTGNHITVRYQPDYMEIFGSFQTSKNFFIVYWRESPVT